MYPRDGRDLSLGKFNRQYPGKTPVISITNVSTGTGDVTLVSTIYNAPAMGDTLPDENWH